MASGIRSSLSLPPVENSTGVGQAKTNGIERPKGKKNVGNVVLVFGCQWLSFDASGFRRLRAAVLDNPENHWMVDVLSELPGCYRTASKTKHLPALNTIPGEIGLQELERWFRCDGLSTAKFPLSYTQLAPLLMMTHFVQYGQYLKLTKAKPGCRRESGGEGSSSVVEIVGFCIGLLSGVVVSAARNQEQLRRLGAVALRLAILLGALGDVQEKEEEYTSLATAWRTAELEEKLQGILDQYPGSYTTVRYDENRVTIMTPRRSMTDLQQSLQSAGFTATSVDFNGRYHWPGHDKTLPALFALCEAHRDLQLPDASELTRPLRTNTTAEPVRSGPLHELVLRSILAETCQWHRTFSAVYQEHLTGSSSLVVEFGPERCIPPSFLRRLSQRVIHFADLELPKTLSRDHELANRPPVDTEIAIVGMACRVAGADDLNEFWDLLCAGKSQHREMPRERYANYETPWRPEIGKRTWFGNFVRDIDAFDHKFFKKSPREAMSQDPQQRLILQVAYQALESAGYFSRLPKEKDIGCYIASCTVDYEHNVNCHTASAYAATGLLRSFLAGKLSHHFGWRGPSLCVDTACSGSAVALHHACRAILNGDCSAALVGGANAITSPLAYDNLASASFLSPTGACKPFDSQADGYCRGEGFVAIYVKKLSAALANGDNILATIAGTAVEQNDNCTPIVVPDAPSLAGLFEKVTRRARVHPRDITVVEAHGTGTQVGDPAEYHSVREVLGGPRRAGNLCLGSVKGLVGHTEGVSGMVALAKVVMMIHGGQIPPQPGFESLNPHIKAMPDDHIEICKHLRAWEAGFRAALINNYGACGSNATMVITQGPQRGRSVSRGLQAEGVALPFRLCALDKPRLQARAIRLREFLARREDNKDMTLANVAFNAARQSNPALECQYIFRAKSLSELAAKLAAIEQGDESDMVRAKKSPQPVILCFGGQVGRSVGLNRVLYDGVPLLRHHLEACDDVLKSAGHKSIYPGIFSSLPATDTVQLHTQLFSLQYACARSCIGSGVHVTAVVGHSFGELTALCVAGVLSLSDALTVIVRRATLIRDSWGTDPGGMLAVEGGRQQLEQYMEGTLASIACYNGPRSFTIAGLTSAVDEVERKLEGDSSFRSKRLDVTNAFHSTLVDKLLPDLHSVTDGVSFHSPSIHIERATENATEGLPSSTIIADHLRQPVYFDSAVRRLAAQHPSAVWLEAGSNSAVTSLAQKALDSDTPGHTFHALNITSSGALSNLVSTTIGLWKDHIPCEFWGHHGMQAKEYSYLFLPPYQFEKSRHWLENKPLPVVDVKSREQDEGMKDDGPLFSFSSYDELDRHVKKYSIHTNHPQYLAAVSGHVAAGTAPIAPASVLLDYAVELLRSFPEGKDKVPSVSDVGSDAPLLLDTNRDVWIAVSEVAGSKSTWQVRFLSEDMKAKSSARLLHCVATISMHDVKDGRLQAEFARYARLVSHRRCVELLADPNVDDILQGRNVYRAFAEIVEYSEPYRGVQKLVGKRDESAGCVSKSYSGVTWADAFLCDSFSQCGGFWVNCMTDRDPREIYVASGIEKWVRTPLFADMASARPNTWHVWARHQRADSWYTSDIFVFTPDGALVEMFLGLRYSRVAKNLFIHLLGGSGPKPEQVRKRNAAAKAPTKDLASRIRAVVAEFCAVEQSQIQDESQLADAGVDSLMAMELARELEQVFRCTIAVETLLEADSFADLVQCVRSAVGFVPEIGSDDSSDVDTGTGSSLSDAASDRMASLTESATSASGVTDLALPNKDVLRAFEETKARTDEFLANNQCSGRLHDFSPLQVELCLVLTLEAFENLGSNLRGTPAGERLVRVQYHPQHESLVQYLYDRLVEAALVILDGTTVIRTQTPAPSHSSKAILSRIEADYPEYAGASRLTFYTGSKLGAVLRGEQEGLQLIFGAEEGQKLVSWMYGDEPHNVAGYKLMGEFIKRLVHKLGSTATKGTGPLKILEMGAGTGGGTKWFLPLLAALPIPVEYTFSDISPTFLAQARRKFREYSFIRYCVHDIEKQPAAELQGSQHIIIASNAVHATSSLQESTKHMRQALRLDGVLMMLEMTKPVFAIDLVFGLFRGWWVFNDGRTHAITSEQRWKHDLEAVGYGHVNWTDGKSNEVSVQRVIFATAESGREGEFPTSLDQTARSQTIDQYVRHTIEGFQVPVRPLSNMPPPREVGVLLTGGTGSLGSHLVVSLVQLSKVHKVVCLNLVSKINPKERQDRALAERKLRLSTSEQRKLVVLEADTSRPQLGLTPEQYSFLRSNITHIIHNAWPMNGIKPLSSFEGQFRVIRNLIDLARDSVEAESGRIRFQFVSSLGTVNGGGALEEPTRIERVMANGYNEAKFVCERVIQETLQRYPDLFQATIVRLGQITGSRETGYWNTSEHFPAIVKSSQTIGVFPTLGGAMGWTPVDVAAQVMAELLISDPVAPRVCHVDNPAEQDWASVVGVLAEELRVTKVPFKEWLRRARQHGVDGNPASLMADWLEENFEKMSCRGAMDTHTARKYSKTLSQMQVEGKVRAETVRKYVRSWRERGFLPS
ncbi:polyketide synthase [Aspergillus ustus]|uniref:Polyketide synthase n=1 Tax=Aspergillus ustus TaxID=40382 RepID=A0A0C1EH30_ASPUT|nr:polyketide synthase [Aspergillus ustus]